MTQNANEIAEIILNGKDQIATGYGKKTAEGLAAMIEGAAPAPTLNIHIHGRRWFEKTNGNTYHTVEIWINGSHYFKSGRTYGYGGQYLETAKEWLYEAGFLSGLKSHQSGGHEDLWGYCQDHGIALVDEVDDVSRRKDL